jgi:hypothetical protein
LANGSISTTIKFINIRDLRIANITTSQQGHQLQLSYKQNQPIKQHQRQQQLCQHKKQQPI